MQHGEKNFWRYAIAYLLLGTGTFLIVAELAEWALLGKELSLVAGLCAMWLGVMVLNRLKGTAKTSPSPETSGQTKDGS